jgi:hypothetical protein
MVQSRFSEMTEVCAVDFEASMLYSLGQELLYILDFSSDAHQSFEMLRKQRGQVCPPPYELRVDVRLRLPRHNLCEYISGISRALL